MATVHSFEVLVDSVKNNLCWVFLTKIGFATFEALDTVMKCCICWIKLKWFDRLDYWCLPATVVNIVIAMEHVVGGDASKDVLMVIAWFLQEIRSLLNDQVFGLKGMILVDESLLTKKVSSVLLLNPLTEEERSQFLVADDLWNAYESINEMVK